MILETWRYTLIICVFCIFILAQMGSCSPHTRMKKDTRYQRRTPNLQFTLQQVKSSKTFLHKHPDWLNSLHPSSRTQQNNSNLTFLHHSRKRNPTEIWTSSKFHQLISYMLSNAKHKKNMIKDDYFRKKGENTNDEFTKSGASDVVVMNVNTKRSSQNNNVHLNHRKKREVGQINVTPNTTIVELTAEFQGEETLPVEWTAAGNYSAVWLIWKKYNQEKELARESQLAFMSVVFLLSMLSFAVWCTGMCNVKKITYREWNFQSSHDTLTVPEVMRKRWKYLPDESFYEEVIVHDRGTDP